jgi:hypothetical protein
MDDVEALKKQGNAAFKARKLEEAISFYSKAIDLATDSGVLAVLYSNRAQAFLDQKK